MHHRKPQRLFSRNRKNTPVTAACGLAPMLALALAFLLSATSAAYAQTVAYNGPREVRIAAEGGDKPGELTAELITYLDQIDTQPWSVKNDGDGGVWLLNVDAEAVDEAERTALNKLGPEGYLMKVTPESIRVVGNTDLAIQHGMFDLLERLGCRFLTPAEAWTVIPQGTGLHVAQGPEAVEPDFVWRRIWYANGMGVGHAPDGSLKKIKATYDDFFRRTRQGGASRVSIGHSYYATYLRHLDAFEKHPEWARMNKEGQRPPLNKLSGPESNRNWCYSNPQLAELVLADRIELLRQAKEKDPFARMVSMDPNDGSQPCECEPCKALGNGSDQMLFLANFVARGLKEVYPDALVGFLIYPQHILPPENVRLEPNMVASMALAFNQTGLSYDELIRGWIAMGAQTLSIYEYFGVYEWDYGMPKQGRVKYDYIREAIPHFYNQWNVKMFDAQSQASWGRYGPSMYLARKLLWDKDADAEAIYSEYFDTAFGSAATKMRELFDFWDTDSGGQLTRTNLARWLLMMREALDAASGESPQVQRRLQDMAAYLHTVVLYHEARQAMNLPKETEEEIAARDEAIKQHVGAMLDFVWRTRDRQVMQFWGFMTRMGTFGKPTHTLVWKHWVPGEIRKATAHWMTTHEDYAPDEVLALLEADLQTYSGALDGLPTYSADLVPLFPDKAPEPQKWIGNLTRPSVWHIYVEKAGPLKVIIHGNKGTPTHYQSLLITDAQGKTLHSQEPAFHGPVTEKINEVTLELQPGLYRVAMAAADRYYYPQFDPPVRCVYEQSEQNATYNQYFTPGFFYVPKDVDEVRLTQGTLLTLLAPTWDEPKIYRGGDFSIPVGDDDGQLWEIKHVTATDMTLFNVPPYIASSPANMLVPKELIEESR